MRHGRDLQRLDRSAQGWISSPACGADDGGAEDAALLVGDDLDQALRRALGLRAVVLGKGQRNTLIAVPAARAAWLGQADLGQLGVGDR